MPGSSCAKNGGGERRSPRCLLSVGEMMKEKKMAIHHLYESLIIFEKIKNRFLQLYFP
jgi:hypothetical protein